MKVKSLSHFQLFATPWTAAHQAPPLMEFSRQEYWSGVPLPSPIVAPIINLKIQQCWGFPGGSVVRTLPSNAGDEGSDLCQGVKIPHAAAAAAKLLQSCPTLCDPIDGSPPGSPVPGILQARTLEWVAISFSSARK